MTSSSAPSETTPGTTNDVGRRTVLAVGAAGIGAVALGQAAPAAAATGPFRHGVASGDPHPTDVILWTRVTPTAASLPGSGRGPEVTVTWQVARDPSFRSVVAHGSISTGPARDHTVKLLARGLRAATTYYYRFTYSGRHSPVGRTRTAPAATASPANLRFGIISCANLQAGYFSAYRHLARRTDLDAVIHLGDYFYEYGPGEYGYGYDNVDIRPHQPAHEVLTLTDYQQRHAQYKTDPDLQALHARMPWILTWDDHEIADDQWKDGALNHQPEEGSYAARRKAAHRAYDEWMPVRMGSTVAVGDGDQLYRRFRFGTLAELSMMDLRSYRDQQVSATAGDADDPARTITGDAQMEWLKAGLGTQDVQWKLVGNPVMIAPVVFPPLPTELTGHVNDVAHLLPADGEPYNYDQWDGYTADRHEVFGYLSDHGVQDTVFLTGDIHSAWACDLPMDAGTYPVTPSVGVEFVGTSITSNNLCDITGTPPRTTSLGVEAAFQTSNRHVKYLDFDDHGYGVLDVTSARTQMDYYVIGDRGDRNAGVSWSTSWATDATTQKVHVVDRPVA